MTINKKIRFGFLILVLLMGFTAKAQKFDINACNDSLLKCHQTKDGGCLVFHGKQYIQYKPSDYSGYATVAMGYFFQSRYDESVNYYTQAINVLRTPKMRDDSIVFPCLMVERGISYFQTGNLNAAKPDFDYGIANPSLFIHSALLYRAGIYEIESDYTNAILDYNKALKIDWYADAQQVYVLRALAYRAAGMADKASKDLDSALNVDEPIPFLNAYAYYLFGNNKKAEVAISKMVHGAEKENLNTIYFHALSYYLLTGDNKKRDFYFKKIDWQKAKKDILLDRIELFRYERDNQKMQEFLKNIKMK